MLIFFREHLGGMILFAIATGLLTNLLYETFLQKSAQSDDNIGKISIERRHEISESRANIKSDSYLDFQNPIDPVAQYGMYNDLIVGMSDEKISKAAYFYLNTSANNGFALSQNKLGRIHFEKAQLLGENNKNAVNISASIMWLSRAKSQGDSCSSALLEQVWLYLGLSDSFIVCAGINDGSQMEKCVAGSQAACIQEGVDLVKSGYHKASGAYLFFQSCKNNSALGCMYLSKMYGSGVELPKSKEFSEMYKNYAMKIDKNITSFPLRDF